MRCPTHGPHCNGRGYWTDCPTCGREVFYYHCDHGSKVFFDDVGNGWPKHECVIARRALSPETQARYRELEALGDRAATTRVRPRAHEPAPKQASRFAAMPTTAGSKVRGFFGRLVGAPATAPRVKVPTLKDVEARTGARVSKTATVQDVRYVLPRAEQAELQVIRTQDPATCLKECSYGSVRLCAYDVSTNTLQRYLCYAPADDLDDLEQDQRAQADLVAQTLANGRVGWVCVRLMPPTR